MKNFLLLAFLFIVSGKSMLAQDSPSIRRVVFNAILKGTNRQITSGRLFAITDSSVLITKKAVALKFSDVDLKEGKIFSFTEIEKLQLQRKGNVGRGVLIGSLTGGLLIGIAAAISTSSTSANTGFRYSTGGVEVVGGVFIGAVGGALIGAIIGALSHKTFFIRGKKERFDKMRTKMIAKLTISNQ